MSGAIRRPRSSRYLWVSGLPASSPGLLLARQRRGRIAGRGTSAERLVRGRPRAGSPPPPRRRGAGRGARHRCRGCRARGDPRRSDRREGPRRRPGRRAHSRLRPRRARRLVRRARERGRALELARPQCAAGSVGAPRRRADRGRARPREHRRRPVRRPRGGRRPRAARPAPLRPAASSVHGGALRGPPAPRRGTAARRAGAPRGRGRPRGAPLEPPVRRLPRAHRQRARRRGARARPAGRLPVPPAAAGAARRCRGRRCARLLTGAGSLLPVVRVGAGARRRHAAALADRRPRPAGRQRTHGARGAVAVVGARRFPPRSSATPSTSRPSRDAACSSWEERLRRSSSRSPSSPRARSGATSRRPGAGSPGTGRVGGKALSSRGRSARPSASGARSPAGSSVASEAPSQPPRRMHPWERCSRRASSRRPACSWGSRRLSSPPP